MLKAMNGGLSGLLLLGSAAMIWAEQAVQDWIPAELALPADMEVTVDRAIGSTTRMFAFVTGTDPDELMDDWRSTLEGTSYRVEPGTDALADRTIEFSGNGIANAKIAVAPASGDGRTVVQMDASLD